MSRRILVRTFLGALILLLAAGGWIFQREIGRTFSKRCYGSGTKSSTMSTQNGLGTRKSSVHSLSGTPSASWL